MMAACPPPSSCIVAPWRRCVPGGSRTRATSSSRRARSPSDPDLARARRPVAAPTSTPRRARSTPASTGAQALVADDRLSGAHPRPRLGAAGPAPPAHGAVEAALEAFSTAIPLLGDEPEEAGRALLNRGSLHLRRGQPAGRHRRPHRRPNASSAAPALTRPARQGRAQPRLRLAADRRPRRRAADDGLGARRAGAAVGGLPGRVRAGPGRGAHGGRPASATRSPPWRRPPRRTGRGGCARSRRSAS